jgi:GT2 family glycosyltransferase
VQQLGEADQVLIYDNGSEVQFPGSVLRVGATIHEMWNEGLRTAAAAADARPHNVAVLNNDLVLGPGFLRGLGEGLRRDERSWLACPDWDGLGVGRGSVRPISHHDGHHISGFAFMVRGEVGLRFDEQFVWWYGDTDLQYQVEASGQQVVCVGGVTCEHLEPGWSTDASPVLKAAAEVDGVRFRAKWG